MCWFSACLLGCDTFQYLWSTWPAAFPPPLGHWRDLLLHKSITFMLIALYILTNTIAQSQIHSLEFAICVMHLLKGKDEPCFSSQLHKWDVLRSETVLGFFRDWHLVSGHMHCRACSARPSVLELVFFCFQKDTCYKTTRTVLFMWTMWLFPVVNLLMKGRLTK